MQPSSERGDSSNETGPRLFREFYYELTRTNSKCVLLLKILFLLAVYVLIFNYCIDIIVKYLKIIIFAQKPRYEIIDIHIENCLL